MFIFCIYMLLHMYTVHFLGYQYLSHFRFTCFILNCFLKLTESGSTELHQTYFENIYQRSDVYLTDYSFYYTHLAESELCKIMFSSCTLDYFATTMTFMNVICNFSFVLLFIVVTLSRIHVTRAVTSGLRQISIQLVHVQPLCLRYLSILCRKICYVARLSN